MNTNLQKYLKYKLKYLDLKNELQLQVGGSYPYPYSSLYGGAYTDDELNTYFEILDKGYVPDATSGVVKPDGSPFDAANPKMITSIDDLVEARVAYNISSPLSELNFFDLIKQSIIMNHRLKTEFNIVDINTLITTITDEHNTLIPALNGQLAALQLSETALQNRVAALNAQVNATAPAIASLQNDLRDMTTERDTAARNLVIARTDLAKALADAATAAAGAGGHLLATTATAATAAPAAGVYTAPAIIAPTGYPAGPNGDQIDPKWTLNKINVGKGTIQFVEITVRNIYRELKSSGELTSANLVEFQQATINHIDKTFRDKTQKDSLLKELPAIFNKIQTALGMPV